MSTSVAAIGPGGGGPTGSVPARGSRLRLGSVLTALGLLAAGLAGGVGIDRYLLKSSLDEPPAPNEGPEPTGNDTVTLAPDQQSACGVEVQAVWPEPFVRRVWRPGRIALNEDRLAHVCPPAEGIVREVPVRLGQTVAAGTVLAVLDSRELGQAKLEAYRARLTLATQQEMFQRVRMTSANAEELLRLLAAETPLAEIERQLADKPIGEWRQQLLGAYARRNQLRALLATQRATAETVSTTVLKQTEAEYAAAAAAFTALVEELRFQTKNQLRQAELRFREAQTAADVARTQLLLYGLTDEEIERLDPVAEGAAASHLPIRAPFAGTILEKHAVRSERVDSKTQLFVLADLSVVWVQADLFETDLPLLQTARDRPVVFRAPLAGLDEQPARVFSPGDRIDRTSRTLTLLAEADNPERRLKPGLFVEVGFETTAAEPVLQVPAAAVLRHDNRPFVFVQVAEDRFRKTDVTLGPADDNRIVIREGLQAGDRVVVRGGFVLKSELLKDQMVGE